MFLRKTVRRKDGKEHNYWSIVENRRVSSGRTVQKTVLYLGELNDSQHSSWSRAIEALDEKGNSQQLSLFSSEGSVPEGVENPVSVELSKLELSKPRQWGACWLSCLLWEQLELDEFWQPRLGRSRKGTRWLNVLKTLVSYRLIDPGSEWRLHRLWFDQTALADLLGESFQIASKNTLYRCLDKLVEHKEELFCHLKGKWQELFSPNFDVLLYDLTSTYFESDPRTKSDGLRQFGYSRDKRSDCQQVVIALVVTPEGFPLAYEVMPGNTSDKTTLKDFLEKIQAQYGKARRVWVMDRGVPTEEVLAEMRNSDSTQYIVGTPRGKLTALEKQFLEKPWSKVRESVQVKLLEKDGELFVLAKSTQRFLKEQAMRKRKRKLKKLWYRLKELSQMTLSHNQLLMKLGAAKKEAGRAYSLVDVRIPSSPKDSDKASFSFSLNRAKLRRARRREGSYLLRSNCLGETPEVLWERYIQLTEVEQAFKELKDNLSIRPIYHQKDARIEAHIFVAFLAYCLLVTLKQRCRAHASGLTPRSALDQMAGIQMLDVKIPTTDGKIVEMNRYTQPDKTQQLLLAKLKLSLPAQPPPKIYSFQKHSKQLH